MRMKIWAAAFLALLLCLGLSTGAIAQSTVGTLRGITADETGAVLPGVVVKVLNEDTGVTQSMLTNDTGAFSFILPPGTSYTLTTDFSGFKKTTINKITLRMADTVNLEIKMEVGFEQSLIVDASKDKRFEPPTNLITLDEQQIMGLPLVGNDPMTLITTLPGYRANPLGHEYDTVGGLPMYMMNTVRDGLSVTDGFSPTGVGSGTIMNPDMISEIRLILAPVDAEAGRGNGQIQITTKSGTNKFQWNINYNLRQNALNALGPSTTRFPQPFGATFQYTVSAGGPIIKNKTFYFVNWDHQLRFQRSGAAVTTGATGFTGSGGYLSVPVLTEQARNGVYRYWDGWISGTSANAAPSATSNQTTLQGISATNACPTQPCWPTTVHQMPDGRFLPIAPAIWPDLNEGPVGVTGVGSVAAYTTGTMKCFSVFGNIKFDGSPFNPATDCGQYITRMDNGAGGTPWDYFVPDYNNPVYGVGILPDPSLHATFADPNAPGGVRVTWDSAGKMFDRPPDRTGYMQRLLALMPLPNEWGSSFTAGGQLNNQTGPGIQGNDVLNKSQFAWVRSTTGNNNRNSFQGGTFGVGTGLDQQNVSHQIINLKVDHNLGNHTRISVSSSVQNDSNSRLIFQSRWPEGADGYAARLPRVLAVNGITTISPTMVNEARFGINYNRSTQLPPWDNPDSDKADFAKSFLVDGWADPNNGELSPVYFLPGSQAQVFNWRDNVLPYGTGGANAGLQGNSTTSLATNPVAAGCTPSGSFVNNGDALSSVNCETGSSLFNFANTFSWNRGSHSIRVGGELRLTRAQELSSSVIPQATGGASQGSASDLALATVPEMPGYDMNVALHGGRLAAVAANSADLLYLLSGSVASVSQSFWVNSVDNFVNGTWETWSVGDGQKARRSVQNEYALFFKDDWRIGNRLTLNLGVRYENYGNLYLEGFSTGILNEGYGLFGAARSGRQGQDPFNYWLQPGTTYFTGYGRGCTLNVAGTCTAGTGTAPIPNINVAGQFLPNGQPSYIPGVCPLGSILFGATTPTNIGTGNSGVESLCVNVGGFDARDPSGYVQFVPSAYLWTNSSGVQARTPIFTAAGNCVYGVKQNDFLPVSNCDPSLLTTRVFVGPGSDHPEQAPLYRDRNNIGPAIGFSYRLPVGSRTVLIRGGFQFTFGSAGRDRSIGSGSAGQLTQQQGGGTSVALDQTTRTCNSAATCLGPGYVDGQYALTLADLPRLVPLQDQMYNDPLYFRPSVGAGGQTGVQGSSALYVQNIGLQRSLSATAYAPGYQDPRTENYTFSVSTNLSRTSSLAFNYIGTLGRNRPTGINLNMPNVYHNPELLDALTKTRAGDDVPLFDQVFAGWNLTGLGTAAGWGPIGTCVTFAGGPGLVDPANSINCPSGTIYQSGSAHLRNASATTFPSLRANLSNGNFFAIAGALVNVAPTTGGSEFATGHRNVTFGGFTQGNLLRNGCDRMGTATTTNRLDLINGGAPTGNSSQVKCLPEDWLIINPTLSTGAGSALFGSGSGGAATDGRGLVYKNHWGYTNYHQFQVQYTLRLPSINLQTTYLTSKTLALPRDFYRTNSFEQNALGGTALGSVTGFSDPKTEESRRRDYGEASDSLRHAVRLNGVFQLPVGPGRALLSNAPGWLQKVVGGWQMGIIYNLQSGAPFSIQAGEMMYGASTGSGMGCDAYAGTNATTGVTGIAAANCGSGLVFADIVSPLWSNPQGNLKRGDDGRTTYFGNPNPFAAVSDPQCWNGTVMDRPEVGRPTTIPLSSSCGLMALALKVPNGTTGANPVSAFRGGSPTDQTPVLIMLQNPLPGKQGSLGPSTMRQPGRYSLDANLAKTFMFTERRGIQVRVDATNVLNHPAPADLILNLGPSTGGPGGIPPAGDLLMERFNESNSARSAAASGCFGGNAFCGRNVQFGIRMINN